MTLPATMRSIAIEQPGMSYRLVCTDRATPSPAEGEVLIRVAYAGLNRADIYQSRGMYAPPPGASEVLGLEASGTVVAVGEGVNRWQAGDAVCALLSGGGYADYAIAKAGHCLPVPRGFSLAQAAALPEAVATVWMSLVQDAGLRPGERILIHGGSSGIGTTAIPFARLWGCEVFTTAGSEEKCTACRGLGATAIQYRTQDFVEVIRQAGGVDVVLDMVGGDYIARNMKVLRPGGRLISIAFIAGTQVELSAGSMLMKHLTWKGSTLRARSDTEKAALLASAQAKVWPWLEAGEFAPILHAVLPLEEAMQAQEIMQKSLHIGKILLQLQP